ncbi:MAG: hypothetical protein NC453_30520 [Muribaculum sp.]|nr:hypothetical protein [Muribaculum sp.]
MKNFIIFEEYMNPHRHQMRCRIILRDTGAIIDDNHGIGFKNERLALARSRKIEKASGGELILDVSCIPVPIPHEEPPLVEDPEGYVRRRIVIIRAKKNRSGNILFYRIHEYSTNRIIDDNQGRGYATYDEAKSVALSRRDFWLDDSNAPQKYFDYPLF